MTSSLITIDGRQLKLSNLDKPMYPATGFTKAQVIDYYARIAPILLPHIRDRPITLVRYPDGVEGKFFFEKNCASHRPDWMLTQPVPSERSGVIEFCVLADEPSLVWAANLAALELHPYLHRVDQLDRPTMIVFDLDPGPGQTLRDCARLALELRDVFDHLDLDAYAKTSGGKGMHMAVPLNTAVTYEQTKGFAESLARLMARRHPQRLTANMSKAKRNGRIFIDWSQNTASKTTVAAYSLRAKPEPSVSLPLTWDEVETISRSRKRQPIDMSPQAVLDRADRDGDLFEAVLKQKQSLPSFEAVEA